MELMPQPTRLAKALRQDYAQLARAARYYEALSQDPLRRDPFKLETLDSKP